MTDDLVSQESGKGVKRFHPRIRRLVVLLLTPTPPLWWPDHFDTEECDHLDPGACGFCRFAASGRGPYFRG